MLKIINEELMAYETIDAVDKGKNYTKIKVATSNKLQQYENDERYSRYNEENKDVPKKTSEGPSVKKIESKVDALRPINREIIRISAPYKTVGDFIAQPNESKTVDFDLPMSININSSNQYQPKVEVRCHEKGDDRANLYVVAFPFNGMIKPIAEDPKYRIYKGLIASSAKPFFFNNRKYRKVLYLVIEINKNLFNPEHKYHTDEIDIQLESFALFTDRETNERKTNCEVFTLKILSANGDYSTNWEYSTVNDAIVMTADPGQKLWVTHEVDNTKAPKRNDYSSEHTYQKRTSGQKPSHIEGDMIITTNKHGIRKEIPMSTGRRDDNYGQRNNRGKKSYYEPRKYDYDDYDDNHGKKHGGKNGNRGKGKNRY